MALLEEHLCLPFPQGLQYNGLGLLMTKKIVQQHGGKVSFESAEGSGSVFRLEFPRNRLPEPSASDS